MEVVGDGFQVAAVVLGVVQIRVSQPGVDAVVGVQSLQNICNPRSHSQFSVVGLGLGLEVVVVV